jgi:hypothetical protein
MNSNELFGLKHLHQIYLNFSNDISDESISSYEVIMLFREIAIERIIFMHYLCAYMHHAISATDLS